MANSFSKEEVVAFDQVLEGFDDALVASKMFGKYNLPGEMAERANNTIWRPQPYIAQSFTGIDQSSNFARNYTQLSVPTSLSYNHSVPLTLSATELRDALQEQRLGKAAMQRLESDINVDCSNLAALSGTVVIKRASAASGFDDVAAADTAFNRLGVSMNDRKMMLSSADYNSMASNLAARQTVAGKVLTAYEKARVGEVAGFDTYKLDYAYRLAAAAGTTVTITNATPLYYTPVATTASNDGLTRNNVDNRNQVITIAVGGGTVKVGDAFTIAGVNEVHHITKQDTGSLKTFRITGIVTGAGGSGTVQISPPIISGTGGTDPELQYKNVTTAPTNGALITFLNTVAAPVNPFWQDDAFEIMPGRYVPAANSGMAIMSATTDSGITVTMARQGAIGDLSTKYRWDVFYGLVNLQPEMTGIEMFSQT
jgi:hypothetical protein